MRTEERGCLPERDEHGRGEPSLRADDTRGCLPERAKARKYAAQQDESGRASRYNYTVMRGAASEAKEGFAGRLAKLRVERGVSAREMSLSLGQGAGYINNIENGRNMPSMAMFFEICEFLEISPADFFAYAGDGSPDIEDAVRRLSPDGRELVERLIRLLGGE